MRNKCDDGGKNTARVERRLNTVKHKRVHRGKNMASVKTTWRVRIEQGEKEKKARQKRSKQESKEQGKRGKIMEHGRREKDMTRENKT